jgi:hypothetical protein
MQLPVVVFKLCQKPGMQKLYVIEKNDWIDYQTLVSLVHKFSLQTQLDKTGIAKETLRDLCSLVSTESDRKLIKFAVCEASKYSNTKAKEHLGIQQLASLKNNVQSALEQATAIRREVTDLATAREMSALRCLGLYDCMSGSESDCESTASTNQNDSQIEWLSEDSDDESDTAPVHNHVDPDVGLNKQPKDLPPTSEHLLLMLRESNLNWFAFVPQLKLLMRTSSHHVIDQVLLDFQENLDAFDLNDMEKETIEISRQAYLNDERVMTNNATGLTDLESDDPDQGQQRGRKWLTNT